MIQTKPKSIKSAGYWRLKSWKLRKLKAFIFEQNIKTLLECGSGHSTELFNKCIADFTCPLEQAIAIEHEPSYADAIKQSSPLVSIIQAPLTTCNTAIAGSNWYALTHSQFAELPKLDLLFIDGPPACMQGAELNRISAPHMLELSLNAEAWLILDDAERDAEQICITNWLDRWPERLSLHSRISDHRSKSFMQVLKWTEK